MPRAVFFRALELLSHCLRGDSVQAERSRGGFIEPAMLLAKTLRLLASATFHNQMMQFCAGRSTVSDIFYSTLDAKLSNIKLSQT